MTELDLSPTTAADETVRPLFGPEHEELRASARAFVEREIARTSRTGSATRTSRASCSGRSATPASSG
jgi:hypothetical protein